MPSPHVALFAGQGAQYVGMGKELAAAYPQARDLFAQAEDCLGYSLTKIMFDGPLEELTKTRHCQPALYIHGLAELAILKIQHPDTEIVGAAGLSLGEFTAHAAAETFTFEDGLKLVSERGQFMDEACAETSGAMVAMLGGEESAVKELAARCNVDVANFNAPGQIVLSGKKEEITNAIAQARDAGIRRTMELQVAGAYHSRLMSSAQEKLAAVLQSANLFQPKFPVISNVHAAEVFTPDDIRASLIAQVTGSVRWTETIQAFLAMGHSHFIELGPGKILSGLVKKIAPDAEVTKLDFA